MITQESFNEWRHSEVTKAVFKALFNEREAMKENLVQGNYDAENEVKVKGRCQAVGSILLLTYEDLLDSLKEKYGE